MSPLTKQMFLDAWGHLSSARESLDEAHTDEAKERALCDMIVLVDTVKAACLSYAGTINYERIKRAQRDE